MTNRGFKVAAHPREENGIGVGFLTGTAIGTTGRKVRFETGAAYDPALEAACDLVEMDIQTRLIVRESDRRFVRELARELDATNAKAIVLLGKEQADLREAE